MNKMKIIFLRIICIIISLVFFLSCTDELINPPLQIIHDNNLGEIITTYINLSDDSDTTKTHIPNLGNSDDVIQVSQVQNNIYPILTKGDILVKNLWLLQYDNNNNLIFTHHIGDIKSLYHIPIKLKTGANQQVYFISNTKNINFKNIDSIYNIDKLKAIKYDYQKIENDNEIPMIAHIVLSEISANMQIPLITLQRIAAKIQFDFTNESSGYKIKHISLMNVPQEMHLINELTQEPYPIGSKTSHTMHRKVYHIDSNNGSLIWYMPINCRGNQGTATSIKNKTDKTAPKGQGQYASYISVYCESTDINDVSSDGICSIYIGDNAPNNYNIKPNTQYKIKTLFSGNRIPKEDPRVETNIGNVNFRIQLLDLKGYKIEEIESLIMEINGISYKSSITKYPTKNNNIIEGKVKLEYRDNTLNKLSFVDKNNNPIKRSNISKDMYFEGDTYKTITKGNLDIAFSGLFRGIGKGTSSIPYEVCSSNTLNNVRDLEELPNWNTYHLKQIKDIDLNHINWQPIEHFTGVFDGNRFEISSLNIYQEDSDIGLFKTIEGYNSIVRNTIISSGSINGHNYVGGIAGRILNHARIESCTNKATIKGFDNIGGITGELYTQTNLTNCYNYGEVHGKNSIGGIVGIFRGEQIKNCHNYGNIKGINNGIGGIAGVADTNHNIIQCENRGTISGHNMVGGIEGYSKANLITQSLNCGEISSNGSSSGGVIGESDIEGLCISLCYNHARLKCLGIAGGILGKGRSVTFESVYHIGEIDLYTNSVVGGICGETNYLSATSCYAATKINSNSNNAIYGHLIGNIIYNYTIDFGFFFHNNYQAVGKGINNGYLSYTAAITDTQFRGKVPIRIGVTSYYILSWLNYSQNDWIQTPNYYPNLKDL